MYIYIYNIYRYIHTRTYINMYTFTARGDNARVISRNRYIKVCSRRRTRSIASNSPGGSRRALAGKAAEHPPTSSINFSAQKSWRPIGSIPFSPRSPSSERIVKLGSARRRRLAPLGRRRYFQNIAREIVSRPHGSSRPRARTHIIPRVICIF